MSVPLIVNGITYNYPETTDEGWGPDATNWAVAITQGSLQKSGGLFSLTGDLDFGPNFGLKTIYLKSRSSNIAQSGFLRLSNTDSLAFRNTGNTADLLFTSGSSDAVPSYNAIDLVNLSTAQTLSNKILSTVSLNGATFTDTLNGVSAVFTGTVTASNISGSSSGSNTGDVTLGTAHGLSLSAQVLSLGLSSTSTTGALSNTDWNTFNTKQTAGNYLTALTGDGTASGPGSAALTLTTVNSNVGSFGSSTSIPSFTVNGKGLITAASGNVVIAPAGTLTGTTLNSSVVSSSLTSVGTLVNLTVTNPISGSVTGNAGTVTTNANLTGIVTSIGNATSIANSAIGDALLTVPYLKADGSRTLTGPLVETQQATPASPSTGTNKLYFKNDDKLYILNSAGTEVALSISSGGVTGPGSSTNKGIAVWNGTTGTAIMDSSLVISAANTLSGLATIINGSGTLTLPTSTDTLVGQATTNTLTNKTLTSPIISTIINTGTLTLPTSTDTLVGRATTDTLTNKTLTSPVFTSPSFSTIVNTGTLTLPTASDTLVGRATTDTLTNKTISGSSNTLSNIADGSLTTPYIKADGTRAFTGSFATGAQLIGLSSAGVSASALVQVNGGATQALLSGTTQEGLLASIVSNTSATARTIGIAAEYRTAASAFTSGVGAVIRILTPTVGAGSTVTRNIGIAFQGVGTGGTNNAFIADNEAFTGNFFINSTSTNPSTFGGSLTSNSVVVGSAANTISGLSTIINTGTLTLPTATDTLVARTTTDTLTNKTLTSPAITTPIITGVIDGSNAAAGKVGEVRQSASLGSSINFGTSGQFFDATSLLLTAGEYLISASLLTYLGSATFTSTNPINLGISTTTGNSGAGLTGPPNFMSFAPPTTAVPQFGGEVSNMHISITTSTTYFMKVRATYTGTTPQLDYCLTAVRIR